jgi:hypothetical protein
MPAVVQDSLLVSAFVAFWSRNGSCGKRLGL